MSTPYVSGHGRGHLPTLIIDVHNVSEQTKEEAIKVILEELGIKDANPNNYTTHRCGYWFLRVLPTTLYQITQTSVGGVVDYGGIKAYADRNQRTSDYVIVKLEELLA